MKKTIMIFIGACLLVIATGCSQASQAANQSKQKTSDSQMANQQQANSDNQQNNKMKNQKKDQEEKKAEQQRQKQITSLMNSFDFKKLSKNQSKEEIQANFDGNAKVKGIIPVKVEIPAINVKTEVIKKGLVKKGKYKGHMATPDNAVQVAWYKYGPKPGQQGSAIIAGHVDTYKGPGVFFNLEDLKKGDLVYVTGKNGQKLTFKVFEKHAYPRKNVPLKKVFGYTSEHVVKLLTCTGTFDDAADTHNERLVVSAKLVQNNQKS